MHLDLATLLWVMAVVTTVMGLSVLLAHPRVRGGEGLGAWGLSLLANALSYPAFALRFAGSQEASIVATNVLACATVSLQTLAVLQFRAAGGAIARPWLLVAPVLCTGLVALAGVEAHRARNALVALILLAQAGWLLSLVLRPARALWQERGRHLLAMGSALLALLMAARAGRVVFGDGWHEAQAIPPAIQATTYLVTLAVLLLSTTGYLLMHMERAIEQQRDAATSDALTGALLRRPLMEAFGQGLALAQRERQPYAVLMLDLDHFKRVNDAHGHQAGDAVLRQFAQRVAQRLRKPDMLGRYGGEEFLVLLPSTGQEGARIVAEDIRLAVEQQPFTFGRVAIPVTVSAGVRAHDPQALPGPGADAPATALTSSQMAQAALLESMIADADRALYAAKRNGRNRVEVAT